MIASCKLSATKKYLEKLGCRLDEEDKIITLPIGLHPNIVRLAKFLKKQDKDWLIQPILL